jgi:pyrroline-5-carboxylate reductase
MKFGFVGTGAITEAMVTGIAGSALNVSGIVVSPRGAEIAARLAARFPSVRVAPDNQAVVDAADVLFLAIRPQVAEDVVKALRFRPDQAVVSLIAATGHAALESWIDQPVELVRAIPLPFVAEREGVTAIYPPNPRVAAIFSALGSAVECATRQEYDLLGATSALMGTYFGILDKTSNWLADNGIAASKARTYLVPLFASLSQAAVKSEPLSFDHVRREFSTRGGLNEQLFEDFDREGGTKALTDALDRVLDRIKR